MALIPKGSTDTWGIGLLETLLKVVEALIDTSLRTSIHFHNVIQGFWDRIGTGTVIMELKLTQELVRVDHNLFFLVLIDLRKK